MKIVKEYINEKFTEDSDPIQDLDIGMMHEIKKFVKDVSGIYYDTKEDVLIYCAKHNKTEYVKFLINNGVNIHVYDDTTIGWAVQNKNIELVKFLIDNGANLNVSNLPYGLMTIAKYNRDEDMIKLLKDNGTIEYDKKQMEKNVKEHGRKLWGINKSM